MIGPYLAAVLDAEFLSPHADRQPLHSLPLSVNTNPIGVVPERSSITAKIDSPALEYRRAAQKPF